MTLCLSSDDIPVAMRRDAVEAALATHVRGTIDVPADQPFSVTLRAVPIDSIHVARIETTPLRLETPPDDDGLLYLSFTASGGGLIDAAGEGRVVQAGDVNVLRRDRACTTVVMAQSSLISIAIPRTQIVPRLADVACLYARGVRSASAARLLTSYVTAVLRETGDLPPEEQRLHARHVADLCALMLGATRDDAHQAEKNGLRTARRKAIIADVAANLASPDLSLTWIARRHGISDAYARSLFNDEGTSFTDHVLRERLNTARALLGSPHLAHRTIATIALMAGFGDISWFNQAFRRRFGMTPSDARTRGIA